MDIKALRKQKKVSQQEVADYLGVSRSTVAMWETSANEPDIETIKRLTTYFDVPVSVLLGVQERKSPGVVRVPVLGCIQAGIPVEAIQDVLDWEEIPDSLSRGGEYFALQIRGDSMEPKMSPGDVVIVRKQDTASTGDVAIVIVNGDEATVKRVVISPAGITLMSFNPNYQPIHFSPKEVEELPVRVLGKVVELRAKFN